jgi:hypothetical protein
MNSLPASELLDRLTERAARNQSVLAELDLLPDEQLHLRPAAQAWTALEALRHLNLFNAPYLGWIDTAIRNGRRAEPSATFRPGWLGNKVANWARPGSTTFRVPTFRSFNPRHEELERRELTIAIDQAARTHELIGAARAVDLTHTTVRTIESKWYPLRLGDILRILVYHDWRHVEQAERATRGLAGIRTE